MITQMANYIRADFEEWSGGFPPESTAQIWVYALLASPADVSEDSVVRFLTEWLAEQ